MGSQPKQQDESTALYARQDREGPRNRYIYSATEMDGETDICTFDWHYIKKRHRCRYGNKWECKQELYVQAILVKQ